MLFDDFVGNTDPIATTPKVATTPTTKATADKAKKDIPISRDKKITPADLKKLVEEKKNPTTPPEPTSFMVNAQFDLVKILKSLDAKSILKVLGSLGNSEIFLELMRAPAATSAFVQANPDFAKKILSDETAKRKIFSTLSAEDFAEYFTNNPTELRKVLEDSISMDSDGTTETIYEVITNL